MDDNIWAPQTFFEVTNTMWCIVVLLEQKKPFVYHFSLNGILDPNQTTMAYPLLLIVFLMKAHGCRQQPFHRAMVLVLRCGRRDAIFHATKTRSHRGPAVRGCVYTVRFVAHLVSKVELIFTFAKNRIVCLRLEYFISQFHVETNFIRTSVFT